VVNDPLVNILLFSGVRAAVHSYYLKNVGVNIETDIVGNVDLINPGLLF